MCGGFFWLCVMGNTMASVDSPMIHANDSHFFARNNRRVVFRGRPRFRWEIVAHACRGEICMHDASPRRSLNCGSFLCVQQWWLAFCRLPILSSYSFGPRYMPNMPCASTANFRKENKKNKGVGNKYVNNVDIFAHEHETRGAYQLQRQRSHRSLPQWWRRESTRRR